MIRRPPKFTRTDPLFPYTTRFRSIGLIGIGPAVDQRANGGCVARLHGKDQRRLATAVDSIGIGSAKKQHAHAIGKAKLRRQDQRCAPFVRSEEHTSELQSLMRNSYAVLCLKKKKTSTNTS